MAEAEIEEFPVADAGALYMSPGLMPICYGAS